MKKFKFYTLFFSLFLSSEAYAQVEWVRPMVGTANSITETSGMFGKDTEEKGQTLPAVLWPNGMNFWTPQTRDTELKCIAPYYYTDSLWQGIRNSHWIVGGCTQDFGSFTVMPMMHELHTTPDSRATLFSHDNETATPYLYEVTLPEENIDLALTGTSRAGILKIKYNGKPEISAYQKAYLVINPNSDEGQGFIAVDTARNMIYGYNPVHRIYQGKGQPAGFSGHFVAIPDKKIKSYGVYRGQETLPGVAVISNEPQIGAYVEFDVRPGEEVLVRMVSSYTDHEAALANLEAEIPDWNFDRIAENLKNVWEKRLGSIQIESENTEDLEKFYTAMYHASFLPQEVNDADGTYCAFSTGYPLMKLPDTQAAYYDGYSMWDTYRALHPLYVLLYPTLSGDMMQSLVQKYEQGGWMPIFPCWNSYTAAMIGDHCSSVLADAYVKGIRNFDAEKAYEGLHKNAFGIPSGYEYSAGKGRRALDSYLKYGYIPVEDSVPEAYHKREQTSRTLEYAYDDFCLAQLARELGYDADYYELSTRAQNYSNVINPATGYADGRHSDGSWCGDNPFTFSKHITEGAPCHYTWYVPHDVPGLIEQLGGEKKFTAQLDSMFTQNRYWHGNEPCHQVAWLYAYTSQPWKTAKEVQHIMQTEYLTGPGGLAGNDDAGQMSAWYIFATLGFYPVCPGTTKYAVGVPAVPKATITLENGNKITILREKPGFKKKLYVNGKLHRDNFIDHNDLIDGAILEFK